MAHSSEQLQKRIRAQMEADVDPAVADFAHALAEEAGAVAILFYGSNLRTRSLEGVLDFYLLTPGEQRTKIWPLVSYHERETGGVILRAKVATMALTTFAKAATGALTDTTIWARFVQPSALIWARDEQVRGEVAAALADASGTAAKLAAALGPASGTADDYWRALFQATYKAEFRVEKAGRENDILSVNEDHFAGLLPLALDHAGLAFSQNGEMLSPSLSASERQRIESWWNARRRMGKPLNFARLIKAGMTFEGATAYAAWKIERHTGMAVEVTPFREKHPILAAPGVLWALRKHRRKPK